MTIKEAITKLECLGFDMSFRGNIITGKTEAEPFDYNPHKILSTPERDVFIGQTAKGWQVTSHINFKGIRFRSYQPHYATILNIAGSGKTLEEAIDRFVINFVNRDYNQYDATLKEGSAVKTAK